MFSYQQFLNGRNGSLLAKPDWLRELNMTYDQWLLILSKIDYDEITVGLENLLTEFYITFPIDSEHNKLLHYHEHNGSLLANDVDIKDFENSSDWNGIFENPNWK